MVKSGDELRGNAACAIFSGSDRLPLAAVLSLCQWISRGRSGENGQSIAFSISAPKQKKTKLPSLY